MRKDCALRNAATIGVVCLGAAVPLHAQTSDGATEPGMFSLQSGIWQADPGLAQDAASADATELEESWEISGPIFLRSADPEPPGEVVVKNIFGWETTKGGGNSDWEYELEIEWGVVEHHEFIFEVPFELGDGRVEGNGDITLGYHWRLWKEEGDWPAFAMRQFVRLPSGYHSSGVDYEWRGLFTRTLIPDTMRLHFNPFVKWINGDNEEEARSFRFGGALGVDYRLSADLLLIGDYIYSSGELEDTRDNHTAELGVDWKIDERQKLGVAAEIGLDGDENGPSFGAKISYMLSFGG
ncbi:MAG: hypothetical protein HOP29_15685 [Phycisphaerales bacterium]|nr:hypothetical protein [Phycisphaerales bacterium]